MWYAPVSCVYFWYFYDWSPKVTFLSRCDLLYPFSFDLICCIWFQFLTRMHQQKSCLLAFGSECQTCKDGHPHHQIRWTKYFFSLAVWFYHRNVNPSGPLKNGPHTLPFNPLASFFWNEHIHCHWVNQKGLNVVCTLWTSETKLSSTPSSRKASICKIQYVWWN